MKSSIASIESFGTVDGPGIRTVVFFNECKLRCIYCHNPEMWNKGKNNMTDIELVESILKNRLYFGKSGGVTFSGGEPLLQKEFLVSVCKKLKKENIHIALDTCGVGTNYDEEILKYVDLVLLDIKHTNSDGYLKITRTNNFNKQEEFINKLNKLNKKVWIRQVIVPNITDSIEYIKSLKEYLKKIKNIEKIDFLPYHKLGEEKYIKLNIPYACKNISEMDKDKCNELYEKFKNL